MAFDRGKYSREYMAKYYKTSIGLHKLAKRRAEKSGIEFTIEPEDIIIPNQCPVFGTPFNTEIGGDRNNSPSLDRFDNTLGYIPGNVRVISYRANCLKSDMSIEDITRLFTYMNS